MSELKKNLCNITSTTRNHVYEYLIIMLFSLQSTKEGAWSINMTPAERAKVKSTLCHQFFFVFVFLTLCIIDFRFSWPLNAPDAVIKSFYYKPWFSFSYVSHLPPAPLQHTLLSTTSSLAPVSLILFIIPSSCDPDFLYVTDLS